jgi:hypothetical protein
MQKIFFALSFTMFTTLFSFEDLGVLGKQYKIEEENIKNLIAKKVALIDGKELQKEYLSSIEAAFSSTISLPSSKKDKTTETLDYVVAEFDIFSPSDPTKIVYKKGDKLLSSLPPGNELNLCFIDASNESLAKAVVLEFGVCDYLITNKDIRKISYLQGQKVFPMALSYVSRFGVDVLPTKITMVGDKIIKKQLNVVRLLEKLKRGE